jgi:hypothetical protein
MGEGIVEEVNIEHPTLNIEVEEERTEDRGQRTEDRGQRTEVGRRSRFFKGSAVWLRPNNLSR